MVTQVLEGAVRTEDGPLLDQDLELTIVRHGPDGSEPSTEARRSRVRRTEY